jgi:hypothetical protein
MEEEERKQFAWHKAPLAVVALYFGIVFLWKWGFDLPSPSKAAVALGVVAVVMSLRGEMGGKEKLAWIALSLGLLIVEFQAIDSKDDADRQLRADAKASELAEFSKIAKDIDLTIKKDQEHFDKTMAGINVNIGMLTGGDSRFYLEPGETSIANETVYLMLLPTVKGEYPLRDVQYEVYSPIGGNAYSPVISTIYPNLLNRLDVAPSMEFPDDDNPRKEVQFQVHIATSNGAYFELIKFRKRKGKWIHALQLTGDPKRTVFYTETQRDFGPAHWPKY